MIYNIYHVINVHQIFLMLARSSRQSEADQRDISSRHRGTVHDSDSVTNNDVIHLLLFSFQGLYGISCDSEISVNIRAFIE